MKKTNTSKNTKKHESNAVKKKSNKKKKQAKYIRYELNTNIKINITLSNNDLKKLKTIALKDPNSYLSVEDYLISNIKRNYEYIEANKIFKIKNRSKPYDKNKHTLKSYTLTNPKLQRYKNNITDTMQTTLENYY